MKLQTRKKKKHYSSMQRKHDLICYGLISPQIIGFFVFTIYPIIWAVSKAWYRYTGIPSETKFVGWQNFITLFTQDERYWQALGNTFVMAFCKLPIEIPLALIIAFVMHGRLKGSGFYRTVYYLPCILSMSVVGIMFTSMFSHFGIINSMLTKVGLISENISWFSSKWTAIAVITIAGIWNTFGTNVLYFIAALANVPEELYESAKLDGAGTVRRFISITLPLISPVMRIIVMLAINGTLATSEFILMLTNGGPGGSTEVVMTHLLKNLVPGFMAQNANLGYGSSMAVVTSIILAFTSLMYLKFSKNKLE